MTAADADAGLGEIVFSPGREEWLEFGPAAARRRVGFHDYAAIYAVPGLYEAAFVEGLGMCSARVVVELYATACAQAGIDVAGHRVLDFGAGNGAGGRELRARGVGEVVGLDLEPEAAPAAARDSPGAYDDYVTGDLSAFGDAELARLRGQGLDAVVAPAAIGVGHVPPRTLDRALGLLAPGGVFAFAVAPELLPGGTDRETGYPEFLAALLHDRAEELGRVEYLHRRQVDGSPHDAVGLVGRLR